MILRFEIFFTLSLLIIFFAYHIGAKAKSVIAGLLTGWVLLSAVMVSHNPQIVSALVDLKLRVVAAKGFCMISMLLFFISTIESKWMSSLFLFYEIIAVIQTILLLTIGYGLFGADSMDVAFIACVYPISLLRPKKYPYWFQTILIGIPPLVFLAPRLGNTMFLVLASSFCAYLFLKRRKSFLIAAPLVIASVLLASYYFNGHDFFRHADRTSQWKLFMGWLWESGKFWFGTGTSTFQWIGPILQNKPTDLFIWVHSDFLQILFEQGIPGLILALALIYQCLRLSIKTPWLFATSIGLIVCSLTQFPLRYPVGQFFTLLLIRASLLEEAND